MWRVDAIGRRGRGGSTETEGGGSDNHRDPFHGFIWGWFTKYISCYCLKGNLGLSQAFLSLSFFFLLSFFFSFLFWLPEVLGLGADELVGVCVRVRPCQFVCHFGGERKDGEEGTVCRAVLFFGGEHP